MCVRVCVLACVLVFSEAGIVIIFCKLYVLSSGLTKLEELVSFPFFFSLKVKLLVEVELGVYFYFVLFYFRIISFVLCFIFVFYNLFISYLNSINFLIPTKPSGIQQYNAFSHIVYVIQKWLI